MHKRVPYWLSEELSPRETDVYKLLLQGKNSKEIGEVLYLSPTTIKTHISTIFQKKQVHTQSQLIAKELERVWKIKK